MALPKEYVGHLASQLTGLLEKSGKVQLSNKSAVAERIQQILADDAAAEDRLNQEVRDYLEKYSDQMRRDGISYQEMYKLVKKELMKKHRISSSGKPDQDGSKLSREKVIELSHALTTGLSAHKEHIQFLQAVNDVRLEIVQILQSLLRDEHRMDVRVRDKIRSQKREIPEGSAEWDILFRKYYSEEMQKLGAI